MRTTISLPNEDFEKIKSYCLENDLKMSQIFRQGAKKIIQENGG